MKKVLLVAIIVAVSIQQKQKDTWQLEQKRQSGTSAEEQQVDQPMEEMGKQSGFNITTYKSNDPHEQKILTFLTTKIGKIQSFLQNIQGQELDE